jgi:hypothetical protein
LYHTIFRSKDKNANQSEHPTLKAKGKKRPKYFLFENFGGHLAGLRIFEK